MPINTGNINVTVKAKPIITVGATDRRTLATTNTQPVTLKSQARTINQMADIADVLEVTPTDGDTLVYNSVTDKYEVKKLNASDITIDSLDGGTF